MGDLNWDQLNEWLKELLKILRKDPDNRAAFHEFYQLLQKRIAGFLYKKLSTKLRYRGDLPDLVREGLQDVFLRLHRKQYQFDETQGAKPTTWIFKFAFNVAKEIIRRNRFQETKEKPEDEVEYADQNLEPEIVTEMIQDE